VTKVKKQEARGKRQEARGKKQETRLSPLTLVSISEISVCFL